MPPRTRRPEHGSPIPNAVRRFLRDKDGSPDMMVDGSSEPKTFYYSSPQGGFVLLDSFSLLIMAPSVEPEDFGGRSVLSNGVLVDVTGPQWGTRLDLCDGIPIVRNADWSLLNGGNFNRLPGATGEILTVSWEAGTRHPLHLPARFKLRVVVRDDLASLTLFRAFVKGIRVTDNK